MIRLTQMTALGLMFLVVFLMTGCATERIVVQEIKIPVPVPCKITSPKRPIYPLEEAKKDEEDIFIITQKALAEIELRQGYETELKTAITECNK